MYVELGALNIPVKIQWMCERMCKLSRKLTKNLLTLAKFCCCATFFLNASSCLYPLNQHQKKNWEFKGYRPNSQIPVLQVFPFRFSSSSTSLRLIWQLDVPTSQRMPNPVLLVSALAAVHISDSFIPTGTLETWRPIVFLRVSAGYWLRAVRVRHIPCLCPRTRISTFPAVDIFLNDDDRACDDSDPWGASTEHESQVSLPAIRSVQYVVSNGIDRRL